MTDNIKNDLELLAKEKNPKARSLLIRELTAHYTRRTDNGPSDTERMLFSSLVLDLYDQIDVSVRRDLITLMARSCAISSALASRLAQEKDEVVASLFEHSPMLNETLLLQAVRTRHESVLVSIARRSDVPEDLVDALMARNFANVVCQLLRNEGASFSSNAVLLCAIFSKNSAEVLSLLAARSLADPVFHDLVLHHVEAGCPFLPPAFAKTAQDGALRKLACNLKEETDALKLRGETVSREEVVVQVNLGEVSFDTLLVTLIHNERKEDIVWFLKDMEGLSSKAMEHLLLTEGNKTLTRLLLDQNVSLKTYEALLRWRIDKLGFSSRNLYRDIEEYRQKRRQAKYAEAS